MPTSGKLSATPVQCGQSADETHSQEDALFVTREVSCPAQVGRTLFLDVPLSILRPLGLVAEKQLSGSVCSVQGSAKDHMPTHLP